MPPDTRCWPLKRPGTGVLLSVVAQTANGYFMLRSLDAQHDIAERTLKTREDALEIYTARYQEGLISQLDFSRRGRR